MSTTIDIKNKSPLDASRVTSAGLTQIKPLKHELEWVPSKFNARTVAGDGRTIIWNTRSGAISVFTREQRHLLDKLLNKRGFSGELGGMSGYLREKGFIVPRNENEYRQFRILFGQQHFRTDILELILLSSEDCNFRCTYCYEDFLRGTMLPRVRANIKKLVDKNAAGIRNLGVSWFGGEPLYGFKAIEDLAPYFLDVAKKYSLSYRSMMTTNGYLLTPDIAEKLLAWEVRKFQITIDGTAEQHDRNRPARDGSPTFDVIFSNLRELKKIKQDYVVRVRINFDKDNYPHLDDLLALLEEEFRGDGRFITTFERVGKWGGANDADLNTCGYGEASNVRLDLQRSALKKGLEVETIADGGNMPGNGVCYASRPYNFIIGADGQIMKCTVALDKRDDNVVGMLSDDGELILDNDKFSLWVEPVFESDTNCQKCHMLPSCQGLSCALVRFEENKSPCAATAKPNLHKELISILEARESKARVVSVKR